MVPYLSTDFGNYVCDDYLVGCRLEQCSGTKIEPLLQVFSQDLPLLLGSFFPQLLKWIMSRKSWYVLHYVTMVLKFSSLDGFEDFFNLIHLRQNTLVYVFISPTIIVSVRSTIPPSIRELRVKHLTFFIQIFKDNSELYTIFFS